LATPEHILTACPLHVKTLVLKIARGLHPIIAEQGLTVMVVDDHAGARDLLQRLLAEWGAAVQCAVTTEQALDLMASSTPT
jgi:PleD family two-component response regulator